MSAAEKLPSRSGSGSVVRRGREARSRRSREQNDALVLRLLKTADRPVSAYDIVDLAARSGTRLAANQVYRTIAGLADQRTVVRIEVLNAYMASASAADLCLVCSQCRGVALVEAPALVGVLRKTISDARFDHSGGPLEVQGLCAECRPASDKEMWGEPEETTSIVPGIGH